MVTPEPPVNVVKKEQRIAHTTAIPPGIQPNHARNTRSRRSGARPSASRKPASVNKGIAGSVGDVFSEYVSTSIVAGVTPVLMNRNTAAPPSTAKIGAPASAAARIRAIAGQAG